MAGTCYACGAPRARACRLCGSAACSAHAERLPTSGLRVCGDCARAHAAAARGGPPVDATVDAVAQALLRGGAIPARRGAAGFAVGRDADGAVAVRWRVPRGRDDGDRLGHLESYAAILRGAGVRAFVTLGASEARVVCLPAVGRPLPRLALVGPGMGQPPPPHDRAVVLVAGRVLDVVASGLVLEGTLDEVARQLGVPVGALRVALRELRRVGWVAVQTQATDRITVRLERRHPGHREPVPLDRRRRSEDAWAL